MPNTDKPVFQIFPEAKKAIGAKKCPMCGKDIGEFRDSLSRREYEISGMCQECQDLVFGK